MSQRYPFAVIKEKLHARAGQVSDFAIGSRPVVLPEELESWVEENARLAIKAANPDEVARFREAARDFLEAEYRVSIDADCIVPVPGGRVGMSAFIACLLEPGDGVVVTEPGYPAFARMAAHRQAVVHRVPLDPHNDFAPDLGVLSTEDAASMRVLALNYPNNPTGAVLSASTRDAIHETAGHGSHVFNDAVYGPLTYEGQAACLLGGGAAGRPHFHEVELHSLTKLYPLGPLSGSFLAGSPDSMQAIRTYSEFAWSPMSGLQIGATIWCLEDTAGRRRTRDFFARQMARLRETLVALGFEPYPAPAGIYLLCRVPDKIGGKAVASAEQAATIMMDEFDIAVVPWDVPPNGYLRFSSLYREEDLEKLASSTDLL